MLYLENIPKIKRKEKKKKKKIQKKAYCSYILKVYYFVFIGIFS